MTNLFNAYNTLTNITDSTTVPVIDPITGQTKKTSFQLIKTFIGALGSTGATGVTGATGPAGRDGTNGVNGTTGATGYIGSTGVQGVTGSTGATGPTGPRGSDGRSVNIVGSVANASSLPNPYTGNLGDGFLTEDLKELWVWDGSQFINVGNIVGPQGATGVGETGATGASITGATGAHGNDGATGVQGATGIQGEVGATGAGATGATGPMGPIGTTTPATTTTLGGLIVGHNLRITTAGTLSSILAVAGDTPPTDAVEGDQWWDSFYGRGYVYYQGTWVEMSPQPFVPSNVSAFTNDAGYLTSATVQSLVGAVGATGADGATGAAGADGATGANGVDGATGATGPSGNVGATGANGLDGATGVQGPAGATGAAGARANEDRLTTGSYSVILGEDGVLTVSSNGAGITWNNPDEPPQPIGGWFATANIAFDKDLGTIISNGIGGIGGYSWTFGKDGVLKIPGQITAVDGQSAVIYASTGTAAIVSNYSGDNQLFVQDDGVYVQTAELVTTNHTIGSNGSQFHTDIDIGGGFGVIDGWRQRNSEQIEINIFTAQAPIWSILIGASLGATVIVTYSTLSGNQTFTSVLSQLFTAAGQYDPGHDNGERYSGRINGTLPAGQTGIVSINFPTYTTNYNNWTFGLGGALTFPSGAGFVKGDSGQLKTNDGNTTSLDFRDTSGRGFYTNNDGFSLRGNGSYTWKFDTNGDLTLPTGGSIYGQNFIGSEGTNVRADQTTGEVYISTYGGGPSSTVWTFSTSGQLTAPGHIIPDADLTYDLGSTSSQWRSIYVGTGTVYIGGVALGVNQDNYVTVDGNPIITVNTASGSLTVQGNTNVVLGSVAVSATAPAATTTGSQWFNTVEARTYIAYNNQWIDANPTLIPAPNTYLDDIEIEDSTIYINGSTLTINTSGTLLVNGTQVTGSGGGGDRLTSGTAVLSLDETGSVTFPGGYLTYSTSTLGSPGLVVSTSTLFGFVAHGPGGALALEWVDEVLSSAAAVIVNGPFGSTGSVQILTGTPSGPETANVWNFGNDGVLTLSTASTILGANTDPNVYIETATTATTSTWTFGTNGVLTLPAATPIIKGGGTGTDVIIKATTGTNTATWAFAADGIIRVGQAQSFVVHTMSSANASPSNVVSTFEFGVDGMLTLPMGSTIGESDTTTIITPPGAQAGQSLVIRPTAGQFTITTDHPDGFVPGESISISVSTQFGDATGSLYYTFTGATSQQLGHATTGTLTFSSQSAQTVTWTVPALSSMTTFTFDLTGGTGFSEGGGIYPEALPEITVTLDGSAVSENNHIHLIAGNPVTTDIYLGDDDQYVKIEKDGGNVVIGTSTNTNHWTFATDGSLTIPRVIKGDGNEVAFSATTSSSVTVTLDGAQFTGADYYGYGSGATRDGTTMRLIGKSASTEVVKLLLLNVGNTLTVTTNLGTEIVTLASVFTTSDAGGGLLYYTATTVESSSFSFIQDDLIFNLTSSTVVTPLVINANGLRFPDTTSQTTAWRGLSNAGDQTLGGRLYLNGKKVADGPYEANSIEMGSSLGLSAVRGIGGPSGGIVLQTAAGYTVEHIWQFGYDGKLTLPDGGTLRMSTAPTSSIGAAGDKAGTIAVSTSSIFYCIADYVLDTGTYSVATTDSNNGSIFFIEVAKGSYPQPQLGWGVSIGGTITQVDGAVTDLGTSWRISVGAITPYSTGTNVTLTNPSPSQANIWVKQTWGTTGSW